MCVSGRFIQNTGNSKWNSWIHINKTQPKPPKLGGFNQRHVDIIQEKGIELKELDF